MDVLVSKRALTSGLARVTRIVPNSSMTPGMNLLRFVLRDGHIEMAGSNGDLDVQVRVPADFSGEGVVAIPASVIAQIARALPDDDVTLSFDEEGMGIRSGKFKTRVNLVDPEQAPSFSFPEEELGRVPAGELAGMLDTVRYAASRESYQGVFRGVLFDASEDQARVVATDGFRLALVDAEVSLPFEKPVIIPSKSVDEVVRVLDAAGDGEEAVLFRAGERISVAAGDARMNVSLMDGSFPDYRRVFPSVFQREVRVDAKALTALLQRVNVMTDKQANNRVDLTLEDGALVAVSEGAYGKARETLACDTGSGGGEEPLQISFNAGYVLDALKPIAGEALMQISGSTTPCIVSPTDEGQGYTAMVVPLRTG